MGQAVKDLIIEQLVNFKVEHIYGYAGDTILSFFSSLANSAIKLYTTKHESTAGLMASAEAKLKNRIGVCVVHSGPGTANIINGIADAYSDRVPLLLISGQVETYNIGTDYRQYVNQLELTNPLTVYSALIINPESVIELFYKAMTTSLQLGGVSHLVIPKDIWEQESSALARQYPAYLDGKVLPHPELIAQVVTAIEQTDKIAILYGRGARECIEELRELAEKIKAPLINTLPAAGLIKREHYLALGGLGLAGSEDATKILQEAELILIFAATWWPNNYTPVQPRVIQFDACRENIGANHPVELGVYGELKYSLKKMLETMPDKKNKDWLDRIKQVEHSSPSNPDSGKEKSSPLLSPDQGIPVISDQIRKQEIITLDSGDNVLWFSKYFTNKCQDVLISGSWRTMGFGLPAALAAKINFPDNPVTTITGDGGLTMVLAELLTARRYNLAVRVIILNNNSLAMEKNRMLCAELNPEEVSSTNPDFVKLANACGVKAFRANNLNQLKEVIKKTELIEQTVLIDIPVSSPILPGTKL